MSKTAPEVAVYCGGVAMLFAHVGPLERLGLLSSADVRTAVSTFQFLVKVVSLFFR